MTTAHSHYVTSGSVPLDERRELAVSGSGDVAKIVPVAGGGVIGALCVAQRYFRRRMYRGCAVPVFRVITPLSRRRVELTDRRTWLTSVLTTHQSRRTTTMGVSVSRRRVL